MRTGTQTIAHSWAVGGAVKPTGPRGLRVVAVAVDSECDARQRLTAVFTA